MPGLLVDVCGCLLLCQNRLRSDSAEYERFAEGRSRHIGRTMDTADDLSCRIEARDGLPEYVNNLGLFSCNGW